MTFDPARGDYLQALDFMAQVSHDAFDAFVRQGFERAEALHLVTVMLEQQLEDHDVD